MIINDPLYGKIKINSPVLIELIKSKPMQRLKKIAQFGIPDEFYFLKNITRFEHSVGVMILLKKLGAKEDEQIAGLLHDVSHTAFSHVIDWVIGTTEKIENYQDIHHKDFVKSKELSKILRKYGYDPQIIFDYKRFGLLERKLPETCADRADYSLREFPKSVAKICIENLIVKDNLMIFKNKASALLFAKHFLNRHINHWGSFEAKSRYRVFGNLLKYAVKKRIIKFDDFWKYDDYIVEKLKKSKDQKILDTFKILRKKSWKDLLKSNHIARKKFRRVDPLYLNGTKLKRLSENDKNFAKILKKAERETHSGSNVPAIKYFS